MSIAFQTSAVAAAHMTAAMNRDLQLSARLYAPDDEAPCIMVTIGRATYTLLVGAPHIPATAPEPVTSTAGDRAPSRFCLAYRQGEGTETCLSYHCTRCSLLRPAANCGARAIQHEPHVWHHQGQHYACTGDPAAEHTRPEGA